MNLNPIPIGPPPRVQAIQGELQKAAHEYEQAKMVFDTIRIRFEVSRDSFARIKQMASERLTYSEWHKWQLDHPTVKYAATLIGPAILDVLTDRAWDAAGRSNRGEAAMYWPYVMLDTIAGDLEKGGFDFTSSAPKREINAALINLSGVVKSEPNWYTTAEHGTILEEAKIWVTPTQPTS